MFSRMLSDSNSAVSLKLLNGNSSSVKSALSGERKLKTWHLALLLGIPSATIASYLIYQYFLKSKRNEKTLSDKTIPINTKSTFINNTPKETVKPQAKSVRAKSKMFTLFLRISL